MEDLSDGVSGIDLPIFWSFPRPIKRKPTASMQAWQSKAIASNGSRS